MDLPVKKRRQTRYGRGDLVPRFSDWFDKPFSTAMELFQRPFGFLNRPFNEFWRENMPAIDVSENDKEVDVRAEIPGMDVADLQISYSQGILTIEGEKKQEEERKQGEMRYKESTYGSFRRDIPIGDDYKWDDVKARYKNGVLTITIPKKEGAAPRGGTKIKIE